MTIGLVYLLVAFALGLGIVIAPMFNKGHFNVTAQNMQMLNNYAFTVVQAVEQEFKDSTLPKPECDAARKAHAIELMVSYCHQINLDISPSMLTVIGGMIESAVLSSKRMNAIT